MNVDSYGVVASPLLDDYESAESGRQLLQKLDYLPWPPKYNEPVGDVSYDVEPYNLEITKVHDEIYREVKSQPNQWDVVANY